MLSLRDLKVLQCPGAGDAHEVLKPVQELESSVTGEIGDGDGIEKKRGLVVFE